MPTLKEQTQKLLELQHRLAVWEAIHHYLSDNFLQREGMDKLQGIRVPGTSQEIVDQEIIEVVMGDVDNHILSLQEEIRTIENQNVVVGKDDG